MVAALCLRCRELGPFFSIKASYFVRGFSLWSMKKEPDLELALSRNHRWILNNQIKNIILRCPDQVAPIEFLQKKFKSLSVQGKALNWLKKYPCCFELVQDGDQSLCRLTKQMKFLVEEEESVKDQQEPVFAERLAKLLMMSRNRRLNVLKINELKRSFGFTDDYLLRIVPKYSDMFRIVNHSGRRTSMEVELAYWNPEFAVSAVEKSSQKNGFSQPCFSCSLPQTWVKSWQKFQDFNSSSYISPYAEITPLVDGSVEMEKRTVALVHELLSLTLWRRLSVSKLSHFGREFALPYNLNVLLLKHPGIFYVSNKYQIYTVLLREGYNGSELIEKDPLVAVKDKYGELMQQGFHEYNRRNHFKNLEKKKKKKKEMSVTSSKLKTKGNGSEISEQKDDKGSGDLGGIFDPEERKQFYRLLFGDDETKSK